MVDLGGRLDRWSVPPTEMLPAFARIAHRRYPPQPATELPLGAPR